MFDLLWGCSIQFWKCGLARCFCQLPFPSFLLTLPLQTAALLILLLRVIKKQWILRVKSLSFWFYSFCGSCSRANLFNWKRKQKKKTQQQPTTIESHVLEDTAFPTAQINYFTENEVGGLMQKQIDSWFQLKLPDVKWWTSFEPNPVFHCCYLWPQKK